MQFSSYLVDVVKVGLHAFNGNVLASLDGLRFKHLRESALTLLADKSVFYSQKSLVCIEVGASLG